MITLLNRQLVRSFSNRKIIMQHRLLKIYHARHYTTNYISKPYNLQTTIKPCIFQTRNYCTNNNNKNSKRESLVTTAIKLIFDIGILLLGVYIFLLKVYLGIICLVMIISAVLIFGSIILLLPMRIIKGDEWYCNVINSIEDVCFNTINYVIRFTLKN